jgi:hypothetical protein
LKKRGVALEHQIEVLRECGFALNPQITVETFLECDDREVYESDPAYLITFLTIASEMNCKFEGATFLPGSERIWSYDAECIEDVGDFLRLALNLRDLADGRFPIENVTDYVNVEAKEVWVAFELNGERYTWAAEVYDDWLDENILAQFGDLFASLNTGKRFTWLHDGGQGGLIGCSTEAQFEQLKQKTGLQFIWLDSINFIS